MIIHGKGDNKESSNVLLSYKHLFEGLFDYDNSDEENDASEEDVSDEDSDEEKIQSDKACLWP
jgi:hypothetical protein